MMKETGKQISLYSSWYIRIVVARAMRFNFLILTYIYKK